jgi:16S rRNA (adenine1518-N6/adenine1519-N6)-dimethyltransferase
MHHLRYVPKRQSLQPKKLLGQHFLQDPSLAHFIVKSANIEAEETVIEIGPGLGALTTLLALNARHVVAVEIDPYLLDLLKDKCTDYRNIEFINKDFLTLDLQPFAEKSTSLLRIVANLPYQITSPVLFKLMDHAHMFGRSILMVQYEVAERLCALPGSRTYGLLTVLLKYHASVGLLKKIPPGAFYPRPKVESALIEVDFTSPYERRVINGSFFRSVVKAAFAMRRKMIKNSLGASSILTIDELHVLNALNEAGIDPRARAETISLDNFITLSDILFTQNACAPPYRDI